MKLILGGRQSGRTEQLIRLCHESEQRGEIAYIVVGFHREAHRVSKRAEELETPIRFPLTFHEFTQGRFNADAIFIDNCDHLLSFMSGKVEAVVFEGKPTVCWHDKPMSEECGDCMNIANDHGADINDPGWRFVDPADQEGAP